MSENLEVFVPIIQDEVNKKSVSGGPSKEKPQQEVTLKRGGTIKKPSPATASKDEISSNEWYNEYVDPVIQMVRDLVEGLPFTVKASLSVIVILWFLYSWIFRAGSRTTVNTSNGPRVVSRAVYLKDIDEGLLRTDIKSTYEQSDR